MTDTTIDNLVYMMCTHDLYYDPYYDMKIRSPVFDVLSGH